MLQAFVITLREGIEAFLIVAISLAYLRKSGRSELLRAVHWGIAAAVAVSAVGGYLLYDAANQEWLDGPLALIAAVSVAAMTIHMWRAGRHMKGAIENHLRSSSEQTGRAAFAGVFLFTGLMISREGIETALLLLQVQQAPALISGAILGVAATTIAKNMGRPSCAATLFLRRRFPVRVRRPALYYGIHGCRTESPRMACHYAATESWGRWPVTYVRPPARAPPRRSSRNFAAKDVFGGLFRRAVTIA